MPSLRLSFCMVCVVITAGMITACASRGPNPETRESSVQNPVVKEEELGQEGRELLSWCRDQQKQAEALREELKANKSEEPLGILERYNRLSMHLSDAGNRSGLMQYTHPDAGVRQAGEICERELVNFSTELSLDKALYDVFAGLEGRMAALDADSSRLLSKTIRDFRRSGVDRDEPTRERIRELNRRLTELDQTFNRNLREDCRHVEVTDKARLGGLPQDFLDAHKPDDKGVIRFSTDWPDYIAVMTYADDTSLREAMYRNFMNLGHPKNGPLLKELLEKRDELAKLLGYRNWAHYSTEVMMIGTPEKVREFVDRVADLAKPRADRDMTELLDYKRRFDKEAQRIMPWERFYLSRKLMQERYAYDPEMARAYFDVRKVRQGVLDISSQLFGIEFRPAQNIKTWHSSVEVFDVTENGQALGRIYLDLYPRENKYKHAAQFSVVEGLSGVRLPEGSIVANFPDPSKSNGPALMEHEDVQTFFHEFGHLLHYILSGKQRYLRFSGVATEWDFVEVPSQLYEEWTWDTDMLRRFATNTKGEAIPADLVKKMRDAEEFGQGIHVRQQMFYAAIAIILHTQDPKPLDLHTAVNEIQTRYSPYPVVEGTYFEDGFSHLIGYSSNYYTYMWSLVIAKDIYATFKEKGLANTELSHAYRDKILAQGGRKDAAELVRDFLGRDFRFDAFNSWLMGK